MSMVINLVEDHNIYLCEGGPVYNGGVQPTPITYLTQWRMMGNSEVHTDEYLTQWKVSGNSQIQQYLTQWKVEGNSVVDNNTILSCGDLGQDGKYHVKISNGVDVFDIALTEPLRKVGAVADNIEFVNGVATLTRNFDSIIVSNLTFSQTRTSTENIYRYQAELGRSNFIAPPNAVTPFVGLCALYNVVRGTDTFSGSKNGIASTSASTQNTLLYIYDSNYNGSDDLDAFVQHISGMELIYQCTPTTEVIQAPQISVSPTNTYSSANDVAYSSFTYANPLIYSCGDYSDVDGKYHVKISNGVTIYDIPLTEPLRKVNNVADSIEFVNGVATLTRAFGKVDWLNDTFEKTSSSGRIYFTILNNNIKTQTLNILSSLYITVNSVWANISDPVSFPNLHINSHPSRNMLRIVDEDKNNLTAAEFAQANANADVEIIYELATPTTETIQVSPFPISPTDTYTSANDTPYSAFEYKKNVEIWSCGEYSAVDGKYHILVQPLGGSIADIALDEPLRKVNNVADTIEFSDGVGTLTRNFAKALLSDVTWSKASSSSGKYRYATSGFIRLDKPIKRATSNASPANILCPIYSTVAANSAYYTNQTGIAVESNLGQVYVYDENYNQDEDFNVFKAHIQGVELIYEVATPTTEVIQVPQIAEAESYTCVISQGAKAVEWSSFETE